MSSLYELPNAFHNKRVLVVGDAILDAYIRGSSDRLCREAPAPVLSLEQREWRCGGAANTAMNIAALGASVTMMTVIGDDAHGRILLEKLDEAGVDSNCVYKSRTRSTVAKTRVSASSTILLRIDEGSTSAVTGETASRLISALERLHAEFDVVVVSDYDNGVVAEPVIDTIAAIAPAVPVVIDARNPARFQRVRAMAAKPNYEEARRVLDLPPERGAKRVPQLAGVADALLEKIGARYVYATVDADGALLLQRGHEPHFVSCVPHDNSHSIGAGDSYVSALALSLCCGADPAAAARVASMAAAVVLQKEGTTACSSIELRAALKGNYKYLDNIEELQHRLREFRNEGKRIVFTNGCFDILHRGHVHFLGKARELGDVLIVGLNSDESIRRIKGPDRPINTLADRVEVLAGLQSVTGLVPFDEDSPVDLIKTVRPDVFVKGGGYTPTAIPEAELVRELGGEIEVIPPEEGFSTSLLIEKIHGRPFRQPHHVSPRQGTY